MTICDICGNSVLKTTAGEVCDVGNALGTAGCASNCKSITANWVCNTGVSPNVCYKCGNLVREYLEICDDGNNADNDGCNSTC